MDYCDFAIIGSGPAGISAALELEDQNTCIIDVGDVAQTGVPVPSLREMLDAGQTRDLLGEQWEMLANLDHSNHCHPKLRARAIRYVMQGEPYKVFDSKGEFLVAGRGSHAAGGMANTWGAQLVRYTQDDLSRAGDWPISNTELTPFYSTLEEHIGISGEQDDMMSFLGPAEILQPPVPIVPAAEYLLKKYMAKKDKPSRNRITLGRPRLAVLTLPHDGRAAHGFGETDFFSTDSEGIYTPRHTLSKLRERGQIKYLGRHKLVRFQESTANLVLDIEDVDTGEMKKLCARHLLVGCGTIQTSRLVLSNREQTTHSLPFLDHPPTLLPIFFPAMLGSKLSHSSFPVQLVGTLSGDAAGDMISFYYPGGMLWSDILPDVPLPINVAVRSLQAIMGCLLVAQIWEPSRPKPGNRLSLEGDGSVRIDYADWTQYSRLSELCSAVRALGGVTLKRFASLSPPSWGFHHAGTLPMRDDPAPFETFPDGRLWDSRRVRIIDGSVLPSLPAKNCSLTIMANAARIASQAKLCEY